MAWASIREPPSRGTWVSSRCASAPRAWAERSESEALPARVPVSAYASHRVRDDVAPGTAPANTVEGTPLRRRLGFSIPAILLLAAIHVPLHDLGIVPEGSVIAGLLVFVPLAIWLAVVLQRQVLNPFITLTVVSAEYLKQVAHEFEMWHWRSRMGFNALAAVSAFVGFTRIHRHILLSRFALGEKA